MRFAAEDVPHGTTFLPTDIAVDTGVGHHPDRTTSALVRLNLTGKWNHGAADTLQICLDARTAERLAKQLLRAGRAAKAQHRQHPGRLR